VQPVRLDWLSLVLILSGLALAALIVSLLMPKGHFTRVLAALGSLAVGVSLCISPWKKRPRRVRLAWLSGSVVVMVLAWYLVPTTHGWNLWSASREASAQLAELKGLPPGDAAGFARGWLERESLVEQFPAFKMEIQEAEEQWIEQSTKKWEDDLARLEEGKLESFDALRGGYKEFLQSPRFLTQRQRLDNAEQTWIQRSVKKWERDLGDLKAADEKDFAAFDKLRARYAPYEKDTLENAELEWVKRAYAKDLKPGDTQAVLALRKRYREGWSAEKLQAAEEDWVRRTVTHADEEVKALMETAPERALKRLTEVGQSIANLGPFKDQQARLNVRRAKALQGVVDVQRGKLMTLFKRQQYEECADRARKFEEGYRQVAKEVGMEKLLTDLRDLCEFTATLARKASLAGPPRLMGLSCSPPGASPASLAIAAWIHAGQPQPLPAGAPPKP
jgi:hypothetical protein